MFLGACKLEGCFHNPFAAFGCCSEAVAEFVDDFDAVPVVGSVDGHEVTLLAVVDVAFFVDRGELEGDLSWVVGGQRVVGLVVGC